MKADTDVKELMNQCMQKIIDGWSVRKVNNMLRKEYDFNDNEILNFMGAVKKFIEEIATGDKDIAYDASVERTLKMIEVALNANNIKVAAQCQDMLNKLMGFYIQKFDGNLKVEEYKFKFGE